MNLYVDARVLQKPHWRGEQLYVHRLLREMTKIGDEHRFHLHFGWEGWDPRIDALLAGRNVHRHEHRGRARSHASLPLAIVRSRSRVYFRMYNEDAAMRVPIPRPVAVLIHDNGRHLLPREYGVVDAPALRRATRRHIRSFELIVTVSETVKGEIVDLFDLAPERIVVAPNAVDPPDLAAPAERPPAVAQDAGLILMVNPGGANKNWQDALAGYARFAARQSDRQRPLLVLAGNLASEQARIAAAIAADPVLQAGVICPGYVPDEQLRWLYRHASVALYPSRYEGFGVPVLEAMAHDLPVIASDIPVLREVAGDAALFVPLDRPEAVAEAIARLLTDERLRAALIERGRERVRAYSWRQSARTALDALLTLGHR